MENLDEAVDEFLDSTPANHAFALTVKGEKVAGSAS